MPEFYRITILTSPQCRISLSSIATCSALPGLTVFGFLQPTRLLLQYFTNALSHLLNVTFITSLNYNEIKLAHWLGIEPSINLLGRNRTVSTGLRNSWAPSLQWIKMVPQSGIEPTSPAYKTGPHPLKVSGANMAYQERFELPSRNFGDCCSANWNYWYINLVACTRIELVSVDYQSTALPLS